MNNTYIGNKTSSNFFSEGLDKFLLYLFLIFSISWSLTFSMLLSNHPLNIFTDHIPEFLLMVLSFFVPTIVGICLILFYEGSNGVKQLFRKFHSRFELKTLIESLLIFPLIYIIIYFFTNFFIPFYAPKTVTFDHLFELLVGYTIIVVGGELGWRGIVLDSLQKKFDNRNAAIITGMLWGLYYFPMVLSGSYFIQWWNFPVIWGIYILVSILISHYYNKTNQSLLISLMLSLLFHLMIPLGYFNYIIGGRLVTSIKIPLLSLPLDLGMVLLFLTLLIMEIGYLGINYIKKEKIIEKISNR